MRHLVGHRARTLTALIVSVGVFAACTATEAPTAPSSNAPGGSVPIQPAPTTNGALALTVVGLPFGVTADITVSGPAGFSRAINASSTLAELPPGRYTVSANRVRVASGPNAGLYAPSAASQGVDVSGGPPTPITITYAALAAIVDVAISGLPQGIGALVTLTPPSGADIVATVSQRIEPALAGRWVMNARPVTDAGFTYTPSLSTTSGDAVPGDTLRFPVQYALSTGAIAVAVAGLPAAAVPTVTVSGPGGFSRSLTGTATVTDLAPGSYTVSAPVVTLGGLSYTPASASQQVTVTASLVASPAVVAYTAQVGSLAIASTGLPAGATGTFSVTGNGINRTVTGDATIDSLAPGNYTVVGSSVTANGFIYAPATPTIVATVVARSATPARFTYLLTTGVLQINATGLPTGANADLAIAGPSGFARTATGSLTLTGLTPGRYTITARDVRVASGSYVASPTSQGVDILAGGAVATATVTYAPLPAVVEVSVTGLSAGSAAIP